VLNKRILLVIGKLMQYSSSPIAMLFRWQPPTPEQLEVDIKIEAIKKEISDLVAEVRCQWHLVLMW